MPRILTRSKNEHMLRIADMYIEQGGTKPIDLAELARFAIDNGHWEDHELILNQLCKRAFSRAFRERYHHDSHGRSVRTFHAVKESDANGAQRVFWEDMQDAPAQFMQTSFKQRRDQVVGECVQLKRDVDSYNEHNQHGDHVQMVFDFTDDIDEREQPSDTYNPRQPR